MSEDKKLHTHSPIFFVQRKGFKDVISFCLLSFMLPTTSEISWTRSGLAYFIVLRKRSNAHAYETFVQHWSGTIHSTRDPLDAYNENISLSIPDSLPAFIVTVASGFEIWIWEPAVHAHYWLVHKIFSPENYSYPPSSGEETPSYDTCSWNLLPAKLWPASPPSPLPSRLTRLKQTSCPICRSVACPCRISNHESCTQWLRLQLALWSLWQGYLCNFSCQTCTIVAANRCKKCGS